MNSGVTHDSTVPARRRIAGVLAAGLVLAAMTVGGVSAHDPAKAADPGDCSISKYDMAVRYQQSANVAALQRQSWLLARERLQEIVRHKNHGKPRAVVADLDETVLDNTALLARDLKACHNYTTWDTWSDWEIKGHPLLTPGARAYFNFAKNHKIPVFYISDRFSENKASTIATLKELGLPNADNMHVMLYGPTKQERRQTVTKTHKIVMLLGDSLADFHAAFKGATPADQAVLERKFASKWGRTWIIFPNSSYGGEWKKADLRVWDSPMVIG